MRGATAMGCLLGVFLWLLLGVAPAAAESRFRAVELDVDPGSAVLAAYQVEVSYDPSAVSLVGIEGGDPPFREPPHYDPRGLTLGRVVLAAFTLEEGQPGPVRVARIHLEEKKGAQFPPDVRVVAAGESDGERIEASARLVPFSGGAP